MNRVKRSVILCLCAALLLIPPMTSCDLLDEIQKQIEVLGYPDYKDLGDEPYRITTQPDYDGTGIMAVVDFNPCFTKPFALDIPDTDENGNPISRVIAGSNSALIPTVISAEDFAVFQEKLEEYYGITYEEANNLRDQDDPRFDQAYRLRMIMRYYVRRSLADCTSEEEKARWLETYPILGKMDIYVLDPLSGAQEILALYSRARKAAPELDDVWYYEACCRTEYGYGSGLGETMTEIRWPSGLTDIDILSFVGSSGLRTVTVPGTVQVVAFGAFGCCDNLEEITFEEGVRIVDEYVLYECPQLKTVNLPASLETLGFLFDDALAQDAERADPTINYAGTMAQWKSLDAEYDYFDIHCSDGIVKATKTRR